MADPSLAGLARRLAASQKTAALSTLSQRVPGHPFGSVVQYALDPAGLPILLLSSLAMHARNLAADPRSSLMIQESVPPDAALVAARLTLVGEFHPVSEEGVRQTFLDRHPDAVQWVDFGDFSFYRFRLADAYYVGGFGVMGWVSPAQYAGGA